MLCVEWTDENPFEIFGYEHEDEYSRLEVVLLPCNYLHTQLGYEDDSIHPECIGDLESQIQYVGPSQMLILTNQERLNPYASKDEMI